MQRKLFLPSLTILLVSLTFLGMVSCKSESESPFDVTLFPVRIEDDGRWSMIDKEGKIVYADEFKNEPSLVVNGIFSVKEGDDDHYVLYQANDKPQPIKNCDNLKDAGIFSEGLIPVVQKNERISVVDKDGKLKFTLNPVKGKEIVISQSYFSDGLLGFRLQDNKCGFIDTNGEVAIDPKYSYISHFNEGLALVGIQSANDSTKNDFTVINKKGETVFKIKKSYQPLSDIFSHGYLPVRDTNEHVLMYNTKGEATKLPAKVYNVTAWNDKTIIFCNNDYDFGIMDYEGEIIVRPKYKHIALLPTGNYLCNNDGSYVILDNKGDQVKKIDDYENMYVVDNWGIIARDKKTSTFLTFEGESLTKEDFADIGNLLPYFVESDYFDVGNVVNALTENITENGIGKYKMMTTASSYLAGEKSASDFTWTYTFPAPDLNKEGYKYSIATTLRTNESIAQYSSDYSYDYGYDYSYKWNPDSKIESFEQKVTLEKDWDIKDCEKITKALKDKGFKVLFNSQSSNNKELYCDILKKGNLVLAVIFNKEQPDHLELNGIYSPSASHTESIIREARSFLSNNTEFDSAVADTAEYYDEPVAEPAFE
ncbi:MAG: WG repeat-containing protein [Muribaculaceae bacterium]|nr:WG repeat-containing protein [Muribaculaceae bacterium]